MIRKRVAEIKGIAEEQRLQLDATGSKMPESKSRRDETSASSATCRGKLIRVQKNWATAFEKMKASSALAVAMLKELDALNTLNEELRSSVV